MCSGGPVNAAQGSGNNYPLRGGKHTAFEGGVRCIEFVAGGFLPPALYGPVNHANIHVADWYATLCGLYGIDALDRRSAAVGGVPPIDSLDAWVTILTVNATTATGRQELAIDVNGNNVCRTPGVSLTILD